MQLIGFSPVRLTGSDGTAPSVGRRAGAEEARGRRWRAHQQPRILIVDDDREILDSLQELIELEGDYEVRTAASLEAARTVARELMPTLALVDIKLGADNGLDLLSELKLIDPGTVCIVMTAYHASEYAVQALRSGADDFLYKPLDPLNLLRSVERTVVARRLAAQKDESERRFRAVFEQSFQLLFILDPDGIVLDANGTALSVGDVNREDVVGRPFWEAPWWANDPETIERLRGAVTEVRGGCALRYEVSVMVEDTGPVTMDLTLKPVVDEGGEVVMLIPEARDISDRKLAEEQLRLASKVFDSAAEGIVITDAAARILDVNPRFSEITGFTRAEVVGQGFDSLEADPPDAARNAEVRDALSRDGRWQGEAWGRRKDGGEFPVRLSIATVIDGSAQTTNYVALVSDISALRSAQDELEHLAHHDHLTGLPNRAMFLDRLGVAVSHSNRHRREMALLFIDIDRFKHVNDSLGHLAGDELLVEVSKRLGSIVRREDTLARLSGDEFVILLSEIEGVHTAEHVARRIVSMVGDPFTLNGASAFATVSVGVALFPNDGADAETLLSNADTAMYSAKDGGRNSFRFFDPEMNARSMERMSVEVGLRRALDRGELYLEYQPKWSLSTRRMVGVEALARWRSPDLGLVPPSRFIPIAEETGLIISIGRFVLREACRSARGWQRDGEPPVPVAVNLSIRQFHDRRFVDDVKSVLRESDLRPDLLEFEVTEGLVMENVKENVEMLQQLKDLGVRISIDDFGTGYSSLSQLKRLPVDTVKIDRSFLTGFNEGRGDEAMVATIIALAKNLRLSVIAEGVETSDQLRILEEGGCHEAQGFLLGRPVGGDVLSGLFGRRFAVEDDD